MYHSHHDFPLFEAAIYDTRSPRTKGPNSSPSIPGNLNRTSSSSRNAVVTDRLPLYIKRLEAIRIDIMDEIVPNHISNTIANVDSFPHMMHIVILNDIVPVIAAHETNAPAYRLRDEIAVDCAILDIALDDHAVLAGIEKTAVFDDGVPRVTQTDQSSFDIRMQCKTGQDLQQAIGKSHGI